MKDEYKDLFEHIEKIEKWTRIIKYTLFITGIILIIVYRAKAVECVSDGNRQVKQAKNILEYSQKMMQVNQIDLNRELAFRNGTWKNKNKAKDPNLDMHKSEVIWTLP